MNTTAKQLRTQTHSLFSYTGALSAIALTILLGALRAPTAVNLPAVLAVVFVTALLTRYPIYLNPIGELLLIPVMTVPALVLYGWPTAVIGTIAGLALSLLSDPPRDVLTRALEEISALGTAGAIVMIVHFSDPRAHVESTVVAAFSYSIVRTLVAASLLHSQEAIDTGRAFRYLISNTAFHLGVLATAATVAVWAVPYYRSPSDHLLIPVLVVALTLQLYLPRILRGQEQRRVLAAVSVLAAAIDAKDPYTADHSIDVAILSRRIARILNLDEPQAHQAYLAGLLHDVGKTVVPPSILLKPGKLTDEEWGIMRSHVEAGVRIIESFEGLADVAPIVAASHERLDGRGYPSGLTGEDIPLGSRINFVVDAYNALTTDRPYRPARSSEAALAELEAHAGTQFDPRVLVALRRALRQRSPRAAAIEKPAWVRLMGIRAFSFLWIGQLVSYLGDQVFLIALTLWIYRLTGSATMLAATLIMATVGQGLLGFFAGALADRLDRRTLMIAADVLRALVVAALPFAILRSIPAGFALLVLLNIGTVFFRAATFPVIQWIVPRHDLAVGNALMQSTERFGEIIGGLLGSVLVLSLGYAMVFYLDAASFVFSAVCLTLVPIPRRAGLAEASAHKIFTEIGEGLSYIWHTPLHRFMAWLILPGYVALAFVALRAPMIVGTAGLSVIAYGTVNSAMGVGKLAGTALLAGVGKQWVTVPFTVVMYLIQALAITLFGATTVYPVLIAMSFLFGFGNVGTYIANATISMANTPSSLLGRLMASRQVFIAATTLLGMLAFGRLSDLVGPPTAIILLGTTSAVGVMVVRFWAGQSVTISHDVRGSAME